LNIRYESAEGKYLVYEYGINAKGQNVYVKGVSVGDAKLDKYALDRMRKVVVDIKGDPVASASSSYTLKFVDGKIRMRVTI
jgi:hypothetical protein